MGCLHLYLFSWPLKSTFDSNSGDAGGIGVWNGRILRRVRDERRCKNGT